MAFLIQRQTAPLNHDLVLKWSQVYPNTLVSAEQIFLRENSRSIVLNFLSHRRKQLEKFRTDRDIYRIKAFDHGRTSHQMRLLVNLITASLLWRTNIPQEAEAIFYLAQKISSNILGGHKENTNKNIAISSIVTKLNMFFNLKVIVPDAYFLQIKQNHSCPLLEQPNPCFVSSELFAKNLQIIITSGKHEKVYNIENVCPIELYQRTRKEMAKIQSAP